MSETGLACLYLYCRIQRFVCTQGYERGGSPQPPNQPPGAPSPGAAPNAPGGMSPTQDTQHPPHIPHGAQPPQHQVSQVSPVLRDEACFHTVAKKAASDHKIKVLTRKVSTSFGFLKNSRTLE